MRNRDPFNVVRTFRCLSIAFVCCLLGCQSTEESTAQRNGDQDIGVAGEDAELLSDAEVLYDTGVLSDTQVMTDAGMIEMAEDAARNVDDASPPENQDCTAIDDQQDWTLCMASPGQCTAVFEDGAGCFAVCAAVGLGCAEVWENRDDACGPDTEREALGCDVRTGHQSDYCVCRGPVGEEPMHRSTTADYEDLFNELVGFGAGTTGGKDGALCVVTTLANSGSGSLRGCVGSSNGPTWIRFEVDGDIRLNTNIALPSNLTIDARGRSVHIRNRGLTVNNRENIIITNLTFRDGAEGDDQDAIQVKGGDQIWIHRCTFSNYSDGLVDLTKGTRDVTVSWNRFSDLDKVMLISANDNDVEDENTRVTIHHNWFKETRQRHPRVRHAKVHAYNNFFDRWYTYAIGCSTNSQCYSEKNVFAAGRRDAAIITQVGEDRGRGEVESDDDLLLGGASVQERGSVFAPADFYSYTADETDGLAASIEANAGAQH